MSGVIFSPYSEHTAAIAAPPQRRRRPALSCVHCRRRKLRCDQKRPCSQCEKSKDAVCTYGSDTSKSKAQDSTETPGIVHLGQPLPTKDAFMGSFHIPTPKSSAPNITVPHRTVGRARSSVFNPAIDSELPQISTADGFRGPSGNLPSETILPYMVYSPDIERHVVPSELSLDVDKGKQPGQFKMKLIGETHWMNQIMQFDKVLSCFVNPGRGRHPEYQLEIKGLLYQCKLLGRASKSRRQFISLTDAKYNLPSKDVCDELVGNYLRTFECVYRIIHVPSFFSSYGEYWSDSGTDTRHPSAFAIQVLLVLAIGSTIQNPNAPSLSSTARQWVHTAQQWLSAPLEKSRMNIAGIQIQCLLVLAREVLGIGSDLLWISAGSLLRTAIQLGYHRDPAHFPGMSVLHGEMRRRLWATIMELGVKESFNTAMPPMISMNDFDTEPPANLNDADINHEMKHAPTSRSLTTFTQTSLQMIMLQSLQSRLELASSSINFRTPLSYDEVLRLHSEITSVARKAQSLNVVSDNQSLTAFQRNYFDYLVIRQPLLTLHRPWAAKARTDPRFYFSRKVCFDTCMAVVSYSQSVDYSRLLTVGSGIWLEIISLPPLVIANELIMQLEEEKLNAPSTIQAASAKASRAPLIQSLRDALSLKLERIKAGEMNVKGYLFLSMALGQIEALEQGEDIEQAIGEAAMRTLKESHEIMKQNAALSQQVAATPTETPPGWENQNNLGTGDGLNYDNLLDTGFDFDMLDSGLLGDWNDQSWV